MRAVPIPPDPEMEGQKVKVRWGGAVHAATVLRRFKNGWVRVHITDLPGGAKVSVEPWQIVKETT